MESSDSLDRRCKQVKESLYNLASTLLEEERLTPVAQRPQTAVEAVRPPSILNNSFAPTPYEDMPLSSARSNELEELRQLLDFEQGKTRRLTEQLHAQDATYQEMNRLMNDLYRTNDDMKAENDQLKAEGQAMRGEIGRLKGLEQHCDALRKQITAFQATVGQKERLLTQVDAERHELAQRNDLLIRKLQELANTAEVRLQEEVRKLEEENEQLALILKATSEENERLKSTLQSATFPDAVSRKVSELQQDVSRVCEDRDRLTYTLAQKETEIRELRGRVIEQEAVLDMKKRPPEWVSREKDALIPALLSLLGQHSPESLLPTVESLLISQRRGAAALQVLERLSKLIQDCAPTGEGTAPPTIKQIWRWVRRLVEEYMTLKRKLEERETREPAILVHDKD